MTPIAESRVVQAQADLTAPPEQPPGVLDSGGPVPGPGIDPPAINPDAPETDEGWQARLERAWQSHYPDDLERAYAIGDFLCLLLRPYQGQVPRGTHPRLKEASSILKVPKVEAERMWRFASVELSLADFRARHPELTSWRAVADRFTPLKKEQKKV